MHDLDRVISVCHHFKVPVIVCINKYDLNEDNTGQIESYCLNHDVELASKIPFDNVVTEALVRKVPVIEYSRNRVAQELEKLWQAICRAL
jgi:MinD superfamily P-loop ATPase